MRRHAALMPALPPYARWEADKYRFQRGAFRVREEAGASVPDTLRSRTRVVVQKYGGTSVANPERIAKVAAKVAAARDAGAQVAVVVSAMAGRTDELIQLAAKTCSTPPARELDALLTAGERVSTALMAMALEECGVPAVSLDGRQCGIITDCQHGRAQIVDIRAERVRSELSEGRVPVVAGFQGISDRGEITTLGRGGSDTTATALAAALGARHCDIFSDVDGVYTTDPRICPDARRVDALGYETMIELARQGAKVLNQRAIEHAREGGVVVRAGSTFGGGGKTIVGAHDGVVSVGRGGARAVAGRRDLVSAIVRDAEQVERLERQLGERVPVLGRRRVGDSIELFFVTEELPDADAFARWLLEQEGVSQARAGIGSVALVGAGVEDRDDARELVERSFFDAGIPVHATLRSPHAITSILDAEHYTQGVRALHRAAITERRDEEAISCAG